MGRIWKAWFQHTSRYARDTGIKRSDEALARRGATPALELSHWSAAPEIDYDVPPIMMGGPGAVCAQCYAPMHGQLLTGHFFCSEDCEREFRYDASVRGE